MKQNLENDELIHRVPKDGIKGFIENWKEDIMSGFMVSLLALPLSLGIAKASSFPAIMGVLTAIVGGVFVGFFSGSRLTIKGPAAGLIVIVAGAVADFGGGESGWKMALGAITIAGIIQVLFGILKMGKFSDFFPLSVIHGMLGAIGIIILSKQLHILMGINPVHLHGPHTGEPIKEPIELFMALPSSIMKVISNTDYQKILSIGIISLLIVFLWPLIRNKYLRKIPTPLIVLVITIPLGMVLGLQNVKGALVHTGYLTEMLGFNVSFQGIFLPGVFIKYVFLFALIGSIESLLTVKAMDILDPFKRTSNANKDLAATGAGNVLAGILGGLPMISEVARSSANIHGGARTRWSNVFHGLFLLVFVVALVPVIELIPNAALAAMLIGVGYKLASPKEFKHTLKIGKEQLVFLVSTTVIILFTDLLIGVIAGVVIQFIVNYFQGLSIFYTFHSSVKVFPQSDGKLLTKIHGGVSFSNYMGISSKLDKIERKKHIVLDLSECRLIDHTGIQNLHNYRDAYIRDGGQFVITGLDRHYASSEHPFSVMHRNKKDKLREVEQMEKINQGRSKRDFDNSIPKMRK